MSFFGAFTFFQKTNKNKSSGRKVKFVRLFFGRNVGLKKLFRICLTFTIIKLLQNKLHFSVAEPKKTSGILELATYSHSIPTLMKFCGVQCHSPTLDPGKTSALCLLILDFFPGPTALSKGPVVFCTSWKYIFHIGCNQESD